MQYAVGPYPTLAIRAAGRLYEAVIGMEIHAQIRMATKLLSPAPADSDATAAPNSRVHAIDAAWPGVMPRLALSAVQAAVRTGLAVDGEVQRVSAFDRKHYFYADLPAGYQVTQWQHPIVQGGLVHTRVPTRDAATGAKSAQERYDSTVRLERIQLEQDSGRSVHTLAADRTLVDLNRAGAGLMEIVSEPDMRSPDEAGAFVRAVATLLRHIGTCDGQMENGSLRADVNVSVREWGATDYGERVEVKNLNSVRSVERAVAHEVDRQVAAYEVVPLIAPAMLAGGEPFARFQGPLQESTLAAYGPSAADMAWGGAAVQRETRSFDALGGTTARLRGKEDAMDYRFLPEPDLPPLVLPTAFIAECAAQLPELPHQLVQRYWKVLNLPRADADVIVGEPGGPAYFEAMAAHVEAGVPRGGSPLPPPPDVPRACANWLCSELLGQLHGAGLELEHCPVPPEDLGDVVLLVGAGVISGRTGKALLQELLAAPGVASAVEVVAAQGWTQVTDGAVIAALVRAVIDEDGGGQAVETAMAEWPEAWRAALPAAPARPTRGKPRKRRSAVAQWLETGNDRTLGALVGRALAACGGKAAPELVAAELDVQLAALRK